MGSPCEKTLKEMFFNRYHIWKNTLWALKVSKPSTTMQSNVSTISTFFSTSTDTSPEEPVGVDITLIASIAGAIVGAILIGLIIFLSCKSRTRPNDCDTEVKSVVTSCDVNKNCDEVSANSNDCCKEGNFLSVSENTDTAAVKESNLTRASDLGKQAQCSITGEQSIDVDAAKVYESVMTALKNQYSVQEETKDTNSEETEVEIAAAPTATSDQKTGDDYKTKKTKKLARKKNLYAKVDFAKKREGRAEKLKREIKNNDYVPLGSNSEQVLDCSENRAFDFQAESVKSTSPGNDLSNKNYVLKQTKLKELEKVSGKEEIICKQSLQNKNSFTSIESQPVFDKVSTDQDSIIYEEIQFERNENGEHVVKDDLHVNSAEEQEINEIRKHCPNPNNAGENSNLPKEETTGDLEANYDDTKHNYEKLDDQETSNFDTDTEVIVNNNENTTEEEPYYEEIRFLPNDEKPFCPSSVEDETKDYLFNEHEKCNDTVLNPIYNSFKADASAEAEVKVNILYDHVG